MRIIYTGGFRFPDSDAAAKRVLSIGYILRDLGHEVIFAGGEQGKKEVQTYENFSYYSQSELDSKSSGIICKIKMFRNSGRKTLAFLKEQHLEKPIDKIIIYNSSNFFISKIKKFCDENNIDIIADITEWYDSDHLPGGSIGPVAIDNMLKMALSYKQIKKHIVISNFLKQYYKKYVSKQIIIPPLLTEDHVFNRKIVKQEYKIVYIGSPGKKDDLSAILECFEANKEKLPNLIFEIVGITEKEYFKNNETKVLSDKIRFQGRISYDKVKAIYDSAHFSFLLRENKRYANAGFSTKLIESLSYGIPLIANLTSDMSNYLINDKNAFIVEHKPYHNLLDILLKVNGLQPGEVQDMMLNAYKTSLRFSYKNYLEAMNEFLKN